MDHDLTATWMVLKVLSGGCLGLGLRVVQATRTLCHLSFVRPLAVWPLRDVPSLSWHQSSKEIERMYVTNDTLLVGGATRGRCDPGGLYSSDPGTSCCRSER